MNSDAALRCFKAGAPMVDLASALGVELRVIEEMVRESLFASPFQATSAPPAGRSLPDVSQASTEDEPDDPPTRSRPRVQDVGGRRRRPRQEVLIEVLKHLRRGSANKTTLMHRTGTTSGTFMQRVLADLVNETCVTKGADGEYSVTTFGLRVLQTALEEAKAVVSTNGSWWTPARSVTTFGLRVLQTALEEAKA